MRAILIIVGIVIILYKFSKMIVKLPGDPTSGLSDDDEDFPMLRGVKELQAELPGLPKSVYQVFSRAVKYHLAEDYESARWEYSKLRHIPSDQTGEVDLYEYSKVFRHNWDLL